MEQRRREGSPGQKPNQYSWAGNRKYTDTVDSRVNPLGAGSLLVEKFYLQNQPHPEKQRRVPFASKGASKFVYSKYCFLSLSRLHSQIAPRKELLRRAEGSGPLAVANFPEVYACTAL